MPTLTSLQWPCVVTRGERILVAMLQPRNGTEPTAPAARARGCGAHVISVSFGVSRVVGHGAGASKLPGGSCEAEPRTTIRAVGENEVWALPGRSLVTRGRCFAWVPGVRCSREGCNEVGTWLPVRRHATHRHGAPSRYGFGGEVWLQQHHPKHRTRLTPGPAPRSVGTAPGHHDPAGEAACGCRAPGIEGAHSGRRDRSASRPPAPVHRYERRSLWQA